MTVFKIVCPALILAFTQGLRKSNRIGPVDFALALGPLHTTNKHTDYFFGLRNVGTSIKAYFYRKFKLFLTTSPLF